MIRNENHDANGLVSATVIDLDAGTLTVEDGQGNVTEAARPLTDDEVARYSAPIEPTAEDRLAELEAALAVIAGETP